MTLYRRSKGTYYFENFHTSLESTFCTESDLKSDRTVENVSLSAQPSCSNTVSVQSYSPTVIPLVTINMRINR